MNTALAWCGFFGAWLLVAGPLFQATRELDVEEAERKALAELARDVPSPQPVSPWWWLFPPAHYVLRHRRSRRYKLAVWEVLPAEQRLAVKSYQDKTDAWLYVAAGASLIAAKETWELHEAYGWPEWAFWALLLGMAVLCIAGTAARVRQRREWLSGKRH